MKKFRKLIKRKKQAFNLGLSYKMYKKYKKAKIL